MLGIVRFSLVFRRILGRGLTDETVMNELRRAQLQAEKDLNAHSPISPIFSLITARGLNSNLATNVGQIPMDSMLPPRPIP